VGLAAVEGVAIFIQQNLTIPLKNDPAQGNCRNGAVMTGNDPGGNPGLGVA
jgi:hypothetical protein